MRFTKPKGTDGVTLTLLHYGTLTDRKLQTLLKSEDPIAQEVELWKAMDKKFALTKTK